MKKILLLVLISMSCQNTFANTEIQKENKIKNLTIRNYDEIGIIDSTPADVKIDLVEIINSNVKEYGLQLTLFRYDYINNSFIDYQEINEILLSLDKMQKLDYKNPILNFFEIEYIGKNNLSILLRNTEKNQLEFIISSGLTNKSFAELKFKDIKIFQDLLLKAKTKIDEIKSKK